MSVALDLLGQVFGTETAEDATYDDCVELLGGSLRMGVVMAPELRVGVTAFLADAANEAASLVEEEVDVFTGDKEFVEVEKHQSPAGVEVAPKEAVPVLEVAMIANIAALGNMGLTAKTVRQLKAMCRLLEVKIGGCKAEIVARLACLAGLEPVPWTKAPEAEEPVAGDPTKHLVSLAELLPRLSHRTSDGRWYLKGYRINFVLESNGRVLKWSQKGIVPKKWTKFAGEAMLVPAVIVVPASDAS